MVVSDGYIKYQYIVIMFIPDFVNVNQVFTWFRE